MRRNHYLETTGYRLLWLPEHPRANRRGYVAEHIVIAEKALGHPLPKGAQVHHHDGDGLNNAHSNLVICDTAYHRTLHKLLRDAYEQRTKRQWRGPWTKKAWAATFRLAKHSRNCV